MKTKFLLTQVSVIHSINAKLLRKLSFFTEKSLPVTFLDNKSELKFAEKIVKYFQKIEKYLPWILSGRFVINTQNTFPHSSGIASSASGFGAIAQCLVDIDNQIVSHNEAKNTQQVMEKASFLARVGSGSACRSIYNGLIVWGKTEVVKGSSDEYAVPYPYGEIHPIFKKFNDWVLLIHEGQKSVSSTVGHSLMNTNPYAERRFQEARENFHTLKNILKNGDMEEFIKLVEHEALTLHAMMMMSEPAFILMKTGTLEVINKIWSFRKETKLPLFFTLDAGANVHLLFPENQKVNDKDLMDEYNSQQIKTFIENELLQYTQNGGIVKDFIDF